MKKHRVTPVALCICLLGLVGIGMSAQAQTAAANEWAWMGGSSSPNQLGVYGQLGVPQAQNIPGGRSGSATWTDKDGNLWLFGGNGLDAAGNQGWLNDLWEYQPSDTPQNSRWTWMGGSSTVTCVKPPGSGEVEICGQPGVYGTLGTPAPANVPGSRSGAVTWIDESGSVWLFGGGGFDAQSTGRLLNDLWRYDPSSNQWTWIAGSDTTFCYNQGGFQLCILPGVYGSLGVPAAGNVPGARESSANWIDGEGNLWLFGGDGYDANGQYGYLNDLWKFDASSSQWTWMGGSNTVCPGYPTECSPMGVYGTLGIPAANNFPGPRSQSANWTDSTGNFWLFGGYGFDGNGAEGKLNDLWKYNPTSNEWTWISGTSARPCISDPILTGPVEACNQFGTYGTLGVPAPGNVPGGRYAVSNWMDKSGNLWLFDGYSRDVTGTLGNGLFGGLVNDLWAFQPTESEWAWMGGDFATSNCAALTGMGLFFYGCQGSQGVLGTKYVAAVGNVPAARQAAMSWTDRNGNFWLFGGQVFTGFGDPANPANQPPGGYIGGYGDIDGTAFVNDLWEFQPSANTLPPAATPIFSLIPGYYSAGGPLILSNGMANASIYYTTDGSTPSTKSSLYTSPITLASSETIEALAIAPGYQNSAVASATYIVAPDMAAPTFSVAPGTYTIVQTVAISDSIPGADIYYTTDGSVPSTSSTRYTGPITVSSSQTISAVAVAFNYTDTAGLANIASNTTGSAYGPAYVPVIAYSGVATSTYTIHLLPPDFSITASYDALTMLAGESAAISMLVTPVGNFSSAVSFSCSGLPSGASCSFSPSSVTPALGTPASTILTINVPATTTASHHFNLLSSGSMLAAVALCFVGRRKRYRQLLLLPVMSIVALASLSGCGTTSSKSATSIVTVTATAGSLQHTATVSLTVANN
jgi:N-acetylneuraminic acid mutarotase